MTEWSEIKRYIPAARKQRGDRAWVTFSKIGRAWGGLHQDGTAFPGHEFHRDQEYDAYKRTISAAKAIFKARDPSFYGKRNGYDRYVIEVTLEVPGWYSATAADAMEGREHDDCIYVSERVVWTDEEPHPLELLAEEAPDDGLLGYVAA